MSSRPEADSHPGPSHQTQADPAQLRTDEDPKVDFNDVFSLRKPKDFKAGLSSGVKSMVKGVVGGAAGLVVAPIVGAKQDGVVGFAKGLGAGIAGAVVLPVTGVAVGTVQMARGVCNQPEAIIEANKGRIWDQEKRKWVDKPDGTIVTAAPRAGHSETFRRPTSGADYYEVLQVPRDATPEQIKRQYYVLARKWHPDKNPGDETAHKRFQLLGEAYQVLCNPELRERYDRHGSDALDVNFMDGGEFFNMLFGNDMFEHLIGELVITAAAKMGNNVNATDMKRGQVIRVEKLVVNLRTTLKRYTAGDEEGFRIAMREEASKLVAASFGETLLHAIGKVYLQQADIQLGGFFGGFAAKVKASSDNVKSQFNAANAALKVYQAQQKIDQWQREQDKKVAGDGKEKEKDGKEKEKDKEGAAEEGKAGEAGAAQPLRAAGEADSSQGGDAKAGSPELTPEEIAFRQELEEAALPLMLEAMWAANVLDIQTTLRKVCEKVLEEPGVSKQELKSRAMGLRELGTIYREAKAPDTAAAQDARRQMEEAMMKVAEKRAGVTRDE